MKKSVRDQEIIYWRRFPPLDISKDLGLASQLALGWLGFASLVMATRIIVGHKYDITQQGLWNAT
jgi:hypothetical protein